MKYSMSINKNGTVGFSGMDMSNGSKPMRLVKTLMDTNKDIYVVKHPGGTCWTGHISPRAVIPVHFMVLKKLSGTDTYMEVECIAEIPLRPQKEKRND